MEKLRWRLVSPQDELDPARYAGDFRDLPPATGAGDWCRVVVHDALGDMQWTLIAVDALPARSTFAGGRPLIDVLGAGRQAVGRFVEHVVERGD
jgi:hypothetical protein